MKIRSNDGWMADLRTSGPIQEEALEDLREIVGRSLSGALTRYLRADDPQYEWLVEESTQETLLKVLDKLETFEGRSQFTTWVYRIAVRTALTELRHKRWQNVSLDEMVENYQEVNLVPTEQVHAEDQIQQLEMVERVQQIILNELTPRQRRALVGLSSGMAMDRVAEQLGTNRNALYKLMHDARKSLKQRLADEGLQVEDIIAAFQVQPSR